MRRLISSLALAAALAAGLAVWAAPARAADEVTVLLDWFVNPDHGPLIVAQRKGFFAARGIDVTFIEPADPNDPPKLVAAGKAEIAVTYQPQLHMQADAGLPLVRFATLVATPLTTVLAIEGGPVKTLADLKGRKVGYSVGGFEQAVLGVMLKSAGLTTDDVELVNVNFALSPSILAGKVAAVVGAYRNFELNQLAIEGHKGLAFYPEEHGVPAYDELILVANARFRESDMLTRFAAAMEEGTQWIVNRPEESFKVFAAYKDGLDDELNRRAWADTVSRFALRPAALDRGRYARMAAFLKAEGVVETTPPVDSYAIAPE